MSATNFSTTNATYRQLMGNGLTYTIPRFQRDYSWSEEEWEDLWADLLGTLRSGGEPAHYMGYLVLQTRDNKFFVTHQLAELHLLGSGGSAPVFV